MSVRNSKRGRADPTVAASGAETASPVPGDVVVEDSDTLLLHLDGGLEPMRHAYALGIQTLTGDMRDFVLDRLRHEQNKRPWNERSEDDQRGTVSQVEASCRDIVTRAVDIVAAAGRRTIRAKLAQVTIKDGVKAQLELSPHDDLRHNLYDAVGSRVLIVVADPEAFEGERAPAAISPDQSDLVNDAMAVHSDESEIAF